MSRILDLLFAALKSALVTAVIIVTAKHTLKAIAGPTKTDLAAEADASVWADARQVLEGSQ